MLLNLSHKQSAIETEVRVLFVVTNGENSNPISGLNLINYLERKACHDCSADVITYKRKGLRPLLNSIHDYL